MRDAARSNALALYCRMATPTSPTVSVVIVSYNGQRLLASCLAALFRGTRQPNEVIIVDNASSDGTCKWLRETYPASTVIASPVNLGFAAANNAGIRRATGDYIFTLNNDADVAPDALDALVRTLEGASKHTAAAMSTMVFAHHPEIIACAGLIVSQDGVVRDMQVGERHTPAMPPYPVFGASAGAALYRRTALNDVGLFDPAYFMYLEDADLAWRLRLRGWETLTVPAATVSHIYSATAGYGSPRKSYYLARNRWWCLLKNMPDTLLRTHIPAIMRYEMGAIGYAITKGERANLAGRAAALRERTLIAAARTHVQARSTVPPDVIAAWMVPPRLFAETLRERQKIADLITKS